MIPVAGRQVRRPDLGTVALLLGMAALALRPIGWTAPAVAVVVGAAAMLVPVNRDPAEGRAPAVILVGVGTVLALRLLLPPVAFPIAGATALAASVATAVAEEALFRRLLYDRVIRWGAPAAIMVSAAAFALIHVPAYGLRALPVNLGAGILFGWQRWASGGWVAPAVTHAAANVLAVW
jgi:membrane protease YdiL (CAAX protease family)